MAAGVGAGTGVMGSLLGKLSDLLVGEYTLLKGVRKEVEFLERELGSMNILLQKMADMDNLEPMAKDWKGKLRDLSYDIEGCIDRFMGRLGNDGETKPAFMKKTARRLRTLWARHDIATQIKDLKARVVEESERRDRYKLDQSSIPTGSMEIDPRLAAFHEEAKDLVAIEGPMKQVISWLVDENVELKVVAIVGSGGLGKTTLAMEVYRKIGEDFQCRASVSVSRTLDLDKLLADVLSQIDENEYSKCKRENWQKEQLIPKLRHILTGKRYFIVIDDVWKEKDWKSIKAAFPNNNKGSRIVATTRVTSVANACCSNSSGQLHQMAPLEDVDSRRLFFKRIFCSDSCPSQLEEVSARILKKCGGLPLAIITLASLLANKPQNKNVWERLQDSIGIDSSLENDGNLKEMKDILLLSYWDLPHPLKTCLLYLSIYPEDKIIHCKELKRKWIAEGFIATKSGNLDQAAENYLIELINRGMIQPAGFVDYDGCTPYCRVHDMVLDLIISLSDEENFATILNRRACNPLPSKQIRRLSVQSSGQDDKWAVRAITESKLHLRSFNMFEQFEQIPTLVDFHSLRVLDLFCQQKLENKDMKNIGSLSQLRYLRIGSANITELPMEIGKLQHLEILDLEHCYPLKRLPSAIVQLRKLVCLIVSDRAVFPADEFGSMQALEEVSNITECDNPVKLAEELGHLYFLRKLSIDASIFCRRADHSSRFLKLLRSSISELCKYNLGCLATSGDIGAYLFRDSSCTFPHLQALKMSRRCKGVPNGMASLGNLVKLDFNVYAFDEAGLTVLMSMPSLTHLYLRVACLADVKTKLTIGSNGFKLLKVFDYIINESQVMGTRFAPGAMPALRQFVLWFNAREVMMSECCGAGFGVADWGLEHLPSHADLLIKIDCFVAILDEVEAVEGCIERQIALRPNRDTHVHVPRINEHGMCKDVKNRKEMTNVWYTSHLAGGRINETE